MKKERLDYIAKKLKLALEYLKDPAAPGFAIVTDVLCYANELLEEVQRAPEASGVTCVACRKQIFGTVFFQGGVREYPVHKGCRIEIKASKDGGI